MSMKTHLIAIIREGTEERRTENIKREANLRNSSVEIEKFCGRLKEADKRVGSAIDRR